MLHKPHRVASLVGSSVSSATADSIGPSASSRPTSSSSAQPRRFPLVLTVGIVVVAIALVGASFALTNGFHSRATSGSTVKVVSQWTYDSIPGAQYDAVSFIAHSNSVLNGSFTNSMGIIVYVMTPTQFESLTRSGVVSGYNWSSGRIPQLTLYDLNVRVAAGPWDLVFLNPDTNPLNSTVVDFWTAVAEIPA